MYTVLHLILLLATCGTLAATWIKRDNSLMWIGIGLFGLGQLASAIEMTYRACLYRKGRYEADIPPSVLKKIDDSAWGWLTVSGLVIIFIGMSTKNEPMQTSGWLLWIIGVVFYALCGVLVSVVGDIPVRMTYGGWKVGGRRRR